MDMRQIEISVFDIAGSKLDISTTRVSDNIIAVRIEERISGMCIVELRTKKRNYIGKIIVR